MVRLKESASRPKITIKDVFQFLNGAIKSWKSIQVAQNMIHYFNSSMVRLKAPFAKVRFKT